MRTGLKMWLGVKRLAAMCVVALTALVSTAAMAQGTSGMLPDPVSSGDLNKFLDRYLDLTPEQWGKVDEFHEQYKEEFKRLRETEIEQFLVEMRTMQGKMPKKAELKAFLDKMDRMQGKIRSLDSKLFDQIQMSLTEDQAPIMPRVRKARERETYRGEMTRSFAGGANTDLTDAYFGIELSAEEKAATESLLTDYESRLTAHLKRLYEATTNSFVVMFDAIEKSGIDFESLQDPSKMDPEEMQQKMQQMMEVVRQATAEASKKTLEISSDVTAMHHSTRASISVHLTPESAKKLRDEFYRKAYPRIMQHDLGTSRQFQAALRLRDLTAEERESVKTAAENFERNDQAAVELLVKKIDAYRATRNPLDWGAGDEVQKHEEEVNELQTKRQTAATQALESLRTMLGPDRTERLARAGTVADTLEGIGELAGEAVASEVAGAIGHTGGQAAAPEGVPQVDEWNSWGGDMFLPGAMGPTDLARIGRILNVDDDGRAILETLHTDYVNSYNELNGTVIKAVQEAQQAQWKQVESGSQEWVPPSEDDIAKTYAARKSALEAIVRLDESFFSNVMSAVADEEQADAMKLVRLHRAAKVYSRGQFWGMMGMDRSSETQVNLFQILDGLALDDGSQVVVDHMLTERAEEMTAAIKSAYHAQMDAQLAQEQWSAAMQAKQKEDPNAAMAMGMEYMEKMKAVYEKVRGPVEKKRTLNRALMADLKTALPADASRKLTVAYNKQAFPQIFTDQKSAEPYLEKASKLGDLSDEQRQSIEAVLTEFREAYDDLCDKMVALSTGSENPMYSGNDPDAWKDYMKREEVMAKHRFDRDEASSKALRRLRTALSREQADRLPGLATADQPDDKTNMYYP